MGDWPALGPDDDLAGMLRRLHGQGAWLDAWYPLSDGRFECRLTMGDRSRGTSWWGVNADPLEALRGALTKMLER